MVNIGWIEIILTLLIGLFIGNFLPSYMRKKAENIATKEDIKGITDSMESVRVSYAKQLEHVKSDLNKHTDLISRKRSIYSKLSRSMRVFIDGHGSNELKAEFLSNYAELWIWASDEVVISANKFVDAHIIIAARPGSIPQEELKQLYAEAVLIMRKDAGFGETKLLPEQYRFLQFVK